jgi:hypothetical protein
MRSLCADLTAKLCCSDAGLEIETSVVGEVTALYSQPMFMRVHRVQLGRDSSHFSRSVIPMCLFLHAEHPDLDFLCVLRLMKGRCFFGGSSSAPLPRETRSTWNVDCIRAHSRMCMSFCAWRVVTTRLPRNPSKLLKAGQRSRFCCSGIGP